jgi:hypothetical protein
LTEKNGLKILIINIGVTGEPPFTPDITRQDLVKVGAVILAIKSSGVYKREAMLVIAADPAVMWDQNASSGRR